MILKTEKILAHLKRLQPKVNSGVMLFIMVVLAIAIGVQGIAQGEPPCCTVEGSGGWSADDKLSEIGSNGVDSVKEKSVDVIQISSANKQKTGEPSADNAPVSIKSGKQVGTEINTQTNSFDAKNSDVILDVDVQPQGSIKGAIHIDYRKFLDGSNRPKSISEISKVLGDTGISRSDSVAIYSESPSAATYVYFILDFLGQERVRLLDNGIDAEGLAGESARSAPAAKPKTKYIPSPRTDIIASYDYVKRDDVLVVDARPSREYSIGAVAGSKNIPYDTVLDGEKIKDQALLGDLFADLSKDKPLVVYSNDGIKASLIWYAMKLEGYDPRLYAGDNWAANLLKSDGGSERLQSEDEPDAATIGTGSSVVPVSSGGSGPKCH
ncbi:MAG: hypothetical protein GYA29_00725 [Methanothrix sp.]|nr:hypothetical protein [Methanothrix sp.]